MKYVVSKRFKGACMNGKICNLPYGTECESMGEVIKLNDGTPVCCITSQNAYDYFSCNDDDNGLKRGKLTHEIIKVLGKNDDNHQKRWDKIWDAPRFERFRRQDIDDYWLWNFDFYNAHIYDLEDILRTVKGA